MTEIALLFDSVCQNTQVRQEAKSKLAAKKAKGKKIRDASMKGQIQKRDLFKNENKSPPVMQKRPKNQFAKEVDSVLKGLHQKADEVRKVVDEERKRDKEFCENQKALNKNLLVLIDSQKATNEMMQSWMNVFIQSTVRPQLGPYDTGN